MKDNKLKYLIEKDFIVSDLMRGYSAVSDEPGGAQSFSCMFFGRSYEKGLIYRREDQLLEAEKAMQLHIRDEHGSVFNALLSAGKEITGITEAQRQVLELLYEGKSDEEVARLTGGKAASTVRNYRFQLRKKRKEALIQSAILELFESEPGCGSEAREAFYRFSSPLSVHDDRTMVTKKEAENIIGKYLKVDSGGVVAELLRWPKKQKEKLVILDRIALCFETGKEYAEKEVNSILSGMTEDYVTIRRYLIDYGLLERQPGGTAYRRR
jgi:hypothetical protein